MVYLQWLSSTEKKIKKKFNYVYDYIISDHIGTYADCR